MRRLLYAGVGPIEHVFEGLDGQPQVITSNLIDFAIEYKQIYALCHRNAGTNRASEMRTYEQSEKSKKTVGSMIIRKNDVENKKTTEKAAVSASMAVSSETDRSDTDVERSPLMGLAKRGVIPKGAGGSAKATKVKKPEKIKKTKEMRTWGLADGKSTSSLDFSKKDVTTNHSSSSSVIKNIAGSGNGSESGVITAHEMQPNLQFELEDEDDADEDVPFGAEQMEEIRRRAQKKSMFGGLLKNFSYNKILEAKDLEPVLSQLRDHLIAKNVAAEIAQKLCDSVGTTLEGKQVNSWTGLKGVVRSALEDSILRILSPNRRINILGDIRAKTTGPYVITFCGVNGVGKSTNLAKICNWLVVNQVRVLVIACDTFRAGAIEQLKTHVTALKAIHEQDGEKRIELYEKGYGKDSAAIAMEAIAYAAQSGFDCCLVDTAGRMQDNEPLMRQLAKLIKINQPDLTLFVGEALVGNEAVDQLTKFNNQLLDHGCRGDNEHSSAINGIVLTKFDTIDDQVGAAVSMTYITGQPIVFVGVGQTYRDLKQLDAKSVVKALMR